MRGNATARRVLPYVIAAAGGFVAAYLIVVAFIFPPGAPPVHSPVPSVIGLTYDDAVTRLSTTGFGATRGEERYNVSAPRATVLAQTPAAGTSTPHGTKIVLDVSSGQRRATVPNLVGMDRQAAEAALTAVGLDVGDVTQRESPLPRDQVISSSPAAGTAMILPSGVSLVVSAGSPTDTLPVPDPGRVVP